LGSSIKAGKKKNKKINSQLHSILIEIKVSSLQALALYFALASVGANGSQRTMKHLRPVVEKRDVEPIRGTKGDKILSMNRNLNSPAEED